jgi:hypothetical protein
LTKEQHVTLPDSSKSTHAKILSISFLSLCIFAVGCATGMQSTGSSSMPQLRGMVHGGSQPISGASIQLYAAGTTGYGTGATALLNTPVTTDATGGFSITGDYTCPSSTSQVYLVATGGNPGLAPGTNNAAIVLMSALGPCTLYGSQYTLNPNSFVFINEATTVASVYALAPFMNPVTTQVGATSTNATGLANAFLSVQNLVNTATGIPLATTPAGNGTVPQAELDTLADILASCVNSNGVNTTCLSLQTATTPSGGPAPTTILQAIYNIATNPASQVAALYALAAADAPFQPTLTTAPNDWTVALTFTTYTAYAGLQNAMAIDASGDIWIANEDVGPGPLFSSVTELSNNGTILSGSTGYTGGGIDDPSSIAIDPSGNVWVAEGTTAPVLTKLSNTGTPLSGSTGYPARVGNIAIDGFGNVWSFGVKYDNNGNLILDSTGGVQGGSPGISIDTSENIWGTVVLSLPVDSFSSTVEKLSNAGVLLSGPNGYEVVGLSEADSIANDHAGNAWITNNSGYAPSVFKFANDGTNLSGPNGYTGGGVSAPTGIAIDGAGNAWVVNESVTGSPGSTSTSHNFMTEYDNNGNILSGATGFTLPVLEGIRDAVDSSGNVWIVLGADGVMELVGAATPAVTPLSLGVKNGTLGTRP